MEMKVATVLQDRMAAIETTAAEIEHNPSAETGYLLELAVLFCDAPIHQIDDMGIVIKSLLTALLKNRGKAMPEVSRCKRCNVPTNGAMWKPHSELCQNLDLTETELSDKAVKAATKVLKRRQDELEDVPF